MNGRQGNIVSNGQGPAYLVNVVLGSGLCPAGPAEGYRTVSSPLNCLRYWHDRTGEGMFKVEPLWG